MAGRRQHNAEFKAKVVLEVLGGEKTPVVTPNFRTESTPVKVNVCSFSRPFSFPLATVP
jgi:hypothetical protein